MSVTRECVTGRIWCFWTAAENWTKDLQQNPHDGKLRDDENFFLPEVLMGAAALLPDRLWDLAIRTTGANCHDSTQVLALLGGIPPLKGLLGRPRGRPDSVLGDRAYDAENIRRTMRARRILPCLQCATHGMRSGLGRWRWVVERTFAWLNQFFVFACGMRQERICTRHF